SILARQAQQYVGDRLHAAIGVQFVEAIGLEADGKEELVELGHRLLVATGPIGGTDTEAGVLDPGLQRGVLGILPGNHPTDDQDGYAQRAGSQMRRHADTSCYSRSLAGNYRRTGGPQSAEALYIEG